MSAPVEGCQRDGCVKLGVNVLAIDGTSIETGRPLSEELHLCDPCLAAFNASPELTLNGVRMLRGEDGRLRAVE